MYKHSFLDRSVIRNYQKIPVVAIDAESDVSFSLYLLGNEGMQKMELKNNRFTGADFSSLLEKGIADVYIRQNEMGRFLDYLGHSMRD